MSRKSIIVVVIAVLGLVTAYSALYTVAETEQIIITQFGEPMGNAVTEAGLHVKVPFTQEANVFGKALAGMERQRQPGPDARQEVHRRRNLRPLAHRPPLALLPALG
jgi:membrane protease subunit HflC